jgi:hypothetical protein
VEIISHRIKVGVRYPKITIVPLGDIHRGTKNCDEKKLKGTVEWIKNNPNTYWIGMGDMAEYINLSDPRFDIKNIDPELRGEVDNLAAIQKNGIVKLLKPIKNKCWGCLEGNHEEIIRKKYHINIFSLMCYDLGVPELGRGCLMRIILEASNGTTRSFTIYAEHGSGGGRKPGSKVNSLIDLEQYFDADIYLRGHVHEKLGINKHKLALSRMAKGRPLRLIEKKKVFALTGSFYRGYIEGTRSYVESKTYPPISTGVVKITVERKKEYFDGKKKNDVLLDIHVSE